MERILTDVSGSGVYRASRAPLLALQIRAFTCQQFQDVVGSGRPCRGRSSQPRIVVAGSSGSSGPARSPRQDDRLGEVVVVRVAGCRRGLRDAARVRFGDLPSRSTLLHDSQELARRDAGHETSGAAVHVIRSHGHCRAPASREAADAETREDRDLHPICTLREQTPRRPRLVCARKSLRIQGKHWSRRADSNR